jgi:hypothetical protein
MTTLREAAQQALEALEKSIDTVRNEYNTDWRHGLPTREKQLLAIREQVDKHEAAINALRAALSEPEQQKATEAYWLIDHTGRYYQNPKHPLNSQRTEPEQEPLFLLHTGAVGSDGEQDDWETEADSGRRVDAFCRKHPGQTIGLYPHTAPQPVELTDEEIAAISAECAASAYRWNDFEFARAVIEAYQAKQEGM